jgi:hypothetical protein
MSAKGWRPQIVWLTSILLFVGKFRGGFFTSSNSHKCLSSKKLGMWHMQGITIAGRVGLDL